MKRMRLLFPQWQGGNNPNYAFGARLLAEIVPQNKNDLVFEVPVAENFSEDLSVKNGVEGEDQLLKQLEAAQKILLAQQPEQVIILGGDCGVSQAPFDYLHGKYQEKFGILWLDAHPDISDVTTTSRAHEMVLANLLGRGAPQFAEKVLNPVKPQQILFAGLIYDELREKEKAVDELNINYLTPAALKKDPTSVKKWMTSHHFEKIAIHFDLDVLAPENFRSIYPAEPGTSVAEFGAAVGALNLSEVIAMMEQISQAGEIVGLSIAEHLPWDAFNLRQALSRVAIFSEES